MPGPQVEVLGVYSLPVTEELFEEQYDILYGLPKSDPRYAETARRIQEQLSSVVLIEALIRNRDSHFDVGKFTQPQRDVQRSNWQVAWAEAYLTLDGETLMVDRWSAPPATGDLRVAFFIHLWNPGEPLYSTYGEIRCPDVREMPQRLKQLVPWLPVD